jgi:hypothetical protein
MLYSTWVGFHDCEDVTPQPWREQWLPKFDLIHVPNNTWIDTLWPGGTSTLDTSEWEY